MKVCGVDEAGRGPVIGPLVMCGAMANEEVFPKLKKLGVKDSKLLSHEERENLFEKVKELLIDFKIIIIEPSEIDETLKSELTNLNQLEREKTAEIINYLMPEKAIVDCPTVNTKKYENELRSLLIKKDVGLVVENKADFNYVIVGAASILAKVTRDREIEKLKKKFVVEFGSGYPSDEVTQKFVEKNWNDKRYKDIIRKEWMSVKNLVEEKKQKKLFDY